MMDSTDQIDQVRDDFITRMGVVAMGEGLPRMAGQVFAMLVFEGEPIASFHVHAETFDVFPAGTSDVPSMHNDIVAFTQTERAILELTFPEKGRYMFHPHQDQIAERGCMGFFEVSAR